MHSGWNIEWAQNKIDHGYEGRENISLQKRGKPRNLAGQQSIVKKANMSKTIMNKIKEMEAMKINKLDESYLDGEKGYGIKWKDFEGVHWY